MKLPYRLLLVLGTTAGAAKTPPLPSPYLAQARDDAAGGQRWNRRLYVARRGDHRQVRCELAEAVTGPHSEGRLTRLSTRQCWRRHCGPHDGHDRRLGRPRQPVGRRHPNGRLARNSGPTFGASSGTTCGDGLQDKWDQDRGFWNDLPEQLRSLIAT